MAETTDDVRRDIELTRERMSSTLAQLERKLNVEQYVRDHPWPALGLAVGAGFLLSGSKADVKAAGATMLATRGASSKLGTALDDIMSRLMHEVTLAFNGHVDNLLDQVRGAIGTSSQGTGNGLGASRGFADVGGGAGAGMNAGTGGMHSGTTPNPGQGGTANPWSTGAGDASLTPSSAGSQSMGGGMR